MAQSWIQAQIPEFISKDEWPSRSPNLNPLDFSVWSILEIKVCRTHDSLDNLKLDLLREWALIPQEVLCTSCEAFQGRLKSVIKNKGGHVEQMLLMIVIVPLAISPSNSFRFRYFLLRNVIKCALNMADPVL